MSFDDYFRKELDDLRRSGREFARAYPELAPMLDTQSRDSDVERLLEGVAFLTARLQQKLDSDLPEVTHALAQVLWPDILWPVPGCSAVQFTPDAKSGAENRVLPRGTQVAGRVQGILCRFQTVYDVNLIPAQAGKVRIDPHSEGQRMTLQVQFDGTAACGIRLPNVLRFYLGGHDSDPVTARMLYHALLCDLHSVTCSDPAGQSVCLPPNAVTPVGFAPDEALWDFDGRSADGPRLYQEYSVFPDKFLYVDLHLNGQADAFKGQELSLRFDFNTAADYVTVPVMRLNTTPVVNLFAHDADPVRADHRKQSFPLGVRDISGHPLVLHSVRQVTGRGARSGQMIELPVLTDHSQQAGFAMRFALPHVRHGAGDPTSLTRIAPVFPAEFLHEDVILSARTFCMNGAAAEGLQVGAICELAENTPGFVRFSNVQGVSPALPSGAHAGIIQSVTALMRMGFASLTQPENLQAFLSVYDRRAAFDDKRRKAAWRRGQSVSKITQRFETQWKNGAVQNLHKITLHTDDTHWSHPGDIFLFGQVLSAVFDNMAGLNEACALQIDTMRSGHEFTFRGVTQDGVNDLAQRAFI